MALKPYGKKTKSVEVKPNWHNFWAVIIAAIIGAVALLIHKESPKVAQNVGANNSGQVAQVANSTNVTLNQSIVNHEPEARLELYETISKNIETNFNNGVHCYETKFLLRLYNVPHARFAIKSLVSANIHVVSASFIPSGGGVSMGNEPLYMGYFATFFTMEKVQESDFNFSIQTYEH